MQEIIEMNPYALPSNVFDMLSRTQHVDEAKKFLRSILNDDKNRQYLLQDSAILFKCLKRFGSPALLADFLMNFHEAPFFNEVLQCFANLVKKTKETDVLNKALIKISQQACEQTLDEEGIDSMLSSLIGSEETARIILHDFLKDNLKRPIPTSCSDFTQTLTSFFVKSQMVAALKILNQKRDWNNSYLYRLVLMIFHLQHKAIFQSKEYRFSRKQAWLADEIKELVLFVRRYANTANQHDPKQTILKNLLTELVFRAANFGQIGLFYLKNDSYDKHMAYFTLEKLTLSLGENIYLWKENVKRHFSKKSPTQLELEKNLAEQKAVIDWQKLAQDTFHLNQHHQMPLYKAYLYHYTGKRIKAEKLLYDLLSEKDESRLQGILYHLSDVAFKLPNRDISHVIFRALENTLKSRPNLIDSPTLFNMAHCHQSLHLRHKKSIPTQDAMLALIKHFGRQKHYKLVEACCKFMLAYYITDKSTRNLHLKQTLEKIKLEAKVEQDLNAISNRWYFFLAKFFKRLRHYGVNYHASSYVQYCDDDKKYIYFDKMPENITTDMMSGQEVYNQLKLYDNIPRLKDMKKRLNEMAISEKTLPKNDKPCRLYFFQNQSVFNKEEPLSVSYDL